MIVGHNVPRHAALLLEYNKRPDIKPINLKSIAVTINFDSLMKTHTHTRSCIDMALTWDTDYFSFPIMSTIVARESTFRPRH